MQDQDVFTQVFDGCSEILHPDESKQQLHAFVHVVDFSGPMYSGLRPEANFPHWVSETM